MPRNIFTRCKKNPILTVEDMPFAAEAVLNPGVVEVDGQVVMLIRVEYATGYSSIHVARSPDGVSGWKVERKPLLEHGLPDCRYEQFGCEDPRVTYFPHDRQYYITYTAYSQWGCAVGLARTRDFVDVERIGLIFSPNNKDAALFPEKFGDQFAVLHRPDAGGGIENIWIAFSPDLFHWGGAHCVLPEGNGAAWDGARVGTGPPPLRTEQGWLLLYHGVKLYAGQMIYRVGVAMLDATFPEKVIARSSQCIFKPMAAYEMTGLAPNVVFPTGLLRRGDELWMYYGAADFCIGLATAKLKDVLAQLET